MDAIARPQIQHDVCRRRAGRIAVAVVVSFIIAGSDGAHGALHVAPRMALPPLPAIALPPLPLPPLPVIGTPLTDDSSVVMELRPAFAAAPGIDLADDVSDLSAGDVSADAAVTSFRLDSSPALIPANPANGGIVAGLLMLAPLLLNRRWQRRLFV
jgi:hypothetical protein